MGMLEGRVAIVTGAGQGIGRAHALLLASEGSKVVVNDIGAAPTAGVSAPAQAVVNEIRAAGGDAVVSTEDVASWVGGQRLIDQAVEQFGRLDALVNNAGVVRDKPIVTMTEEDWDVVIRVHLNGHFVPTHWAAEYWRAQSKAGRPVSARLVHTSSNSGLIGNPGQGNYSAAKAGIASFSIVCAKELERYGVKSNCVAPSARTQMTTSTEWLRDLMGEPPADGQFDIWEPANNSPLVGYLASEECGFSGATFTSRGGTVGIMAPWELERVLERDSRWTVAELADQLGAFAQQDTATQ
jgi:NAD(P)-dependent dehydrogenase (short-subunit alcohol dehydrogenase family)